MTASSRLLFCPVATAATQAEIRTHVLDAFRASGYYSLTRIECEIKDGIAWLSGTVPSFYLKQLAQSLAARQAGVLRVVNHTEVAV